MAHLDRPDQRSHLGLIDVFVCLSVGQVDQLLAVLILAVLNNSLQLTDF